MPLKKETITLYHCRQSAGKERHNRVVLSVFCPRRLKRVRPFIRFEIVDSFVVFDAHIYWLDQAKKEWIHKTDFVC
jgi:hypothetical protein